MNDDTAGHRGWHSRGYFPHFDSAECVQHVTFHLADSLPRNVLARIECELRTLAPSRRTSERRIRAHAWVDAGHGCCVLRDPVAADLVQSALFQFDAVRYRLLAFVIMPNHVHALVEPIDGWALPRIVTSWKSYTGRRLAPSMPAASLVDRVWHREYWDRFVRDEEHFRAVVAYIHDNPVHAGLVRRPQDWKWSSAWGRTQEAV